MVGERIMGTRAALLLILLAGCATVKSEIPAWLGPSSDVDTLSLGVTNEEAERLGEVRHAGGSDRSSGGNQANGSGSEGHQYVDALRRDLEVLEPGLGEEAEVESRDSVGAVVDTLSLAAGVARQRQSGSGARNHYPRLTSNSDMPSASRETPVTAASSQGIVSLTSTQRGYIAPCYADSEYAGYAQPGTATVRVRLLDVIDSTVVSPQVILCPATSCGIEVLAREWSVSPPCDIDSAYGSWLRYATAAWIPSADDADGTTPGDTSRAAVFSGVPSGLWIAVADRSRLGGWTDESNPNTGHSWGTPARRVRLMGLIDVPAGVDTTAVLSWRWTAPDIGNPCIRYVVGVSGDTTWRPPAECQ